MITRRLTKRRSPAAWEPNEADIQSAFFDAWRRLNPPNALAFSVPNEAKRSVAEAARLKRTGMWPGAVDVLVMVRNRPPLALEFKTRKGRQSAEQRAFADACAAIGIPYRIARSAVEALEIAAEHGAALRVRRQQAAA